MRAASTGWAMAQPMGRCRKDWNDWRAAIIRWAGCGADIKREHTGSGGTTRLADRWERARLTGEGCPAVAITLAAGLHVKD